MAQWDSEQLANAQTIIRVGRDVGASDRDIQIALATAMQESTLHNVNYGGGSSIGLFQQIDDWGTRQQRMDPDMAARMFFLGGSKGQKGLLDIGDRQKMSLTEAAQAVQRSAYPDAYAQHETPALQLMRHFGHDVKTGVALAPGTASPTAPAPKPGGLEASPTAAGVATPEVAGISTPDMPGVEATLPAELDTDWTPQPWTLPKMSPQEFGKAFPGGSLAGTDIRSKIVRAALSWLGTPYGWGEESRSAVDCSGLVQAVFGDFGINLPRVSAYQANAGQRVSLDALQPGDLVATDNSPRNNGADHIAIYIGNGQIVEAPKPGLYVRQRAILPDDNFWGVSMASFL